jgi:hypothetical protein
MLKKIHCTGGNGKSSFHETLGQTLCAWDFLWVLPSCVTGNDFLLDSQVMISAKGKLMREGY